MSEIERVMEVEVEDATGWPFFVEVQGDGTLAFSGNWVDPYIITFKSGSDAKRVADLIAQLLKPEVTGSFIPVTKTETEDTIEP